MIKELVQDSPDDKGVERGGVLVGDGWPNYFELVEASHDHLTGEPTLTSTTPRRSVPSSYPRKARCRRGRLEKAVR